MNKRFIDLKKTLGKFIANFSTVEEDGKTYIFDGDERHLDIRAFDDNTKREVYERQGGHCANPDCPRRDEVLDISEMEADHITPWKEGGRTVAENCQMLCRDCNRRKGAR